jgi:hypothetical protein
MQHPRRQPSRFSDLTSKIQQTYSIVTPVLYDWIVDVNGGRNENNEDGKNASNQSVAGYTQEIINVMKILGKSR